MYSYCYVYVFLLLRTFRSVYSVSLCCSVYCLCVNMYCTTATGCQPNRSSQIYHIISYQKIGFTLSPLRPHRERQTTIINGTAKTPCLDVVVTDKKCLCLESIAERPTHSLVNALRYPTEVPIETYKRVYAYRHAYK